LIRDAFKDVGITNRKILRGQIFIIPDQLIVLPEERIPQRPSRTVHDTRLVLVVQNDPDNEDTFHPLVLIAPLSHRIDLQSNKDYRLNAKQGGIDKDSIVLLGLIQPILKTDLYGDAIGKLDSLSMNDIDAILAANLGIIERKDEN